MESEELDRLTEFLSRPISAPADIHPDLQVFYKLGYGQAKRDMCQYFLGWAQAELAEIKWQLIGVLSTEFGRDVKDTKSTEESGPCGICGKQEDRLFLVTFDDGSQVKICCEHGGR